MLVLNLSKKKFILKDKVLKPNSRIELDEAIALKLKKMYPKDVDILEVEDVKDNKELKIKEIEKKLEKAKVALTKCKKEAAIEKAKLKIETLNKELELLKKE